MKPYIKKYSVVVRNFTFGVEDSLVSTVGLLAGIAIAHVDSKTIVLTGVVLIFVEAFSMGVGSLLSEQSVEEYESQKEVALSKPILAAVVMFVSYVVAGLIPLAPYVIDAGTGSVIWSVGLTLAALATLGAFNAHIFRVRVWKDALITLLMGGLAIGVGVVVGQIVGVIAK
ncbi:MAG TPA: VIT1/CCC1 transporter family protein [Patescibacteria group bacterium]|jgi:VIT1/CCC1 family predicted Fe2+/Mn2+ transporter|nr:VIT1/CCC1 transporter family protein [Patescibacteria group bacterium]